ncbi:hypothetical protein FA15DRAFT_652890 [Coprinopsis marcescibilis]|uniref:Uncharacterized protein n=1 Tax=Coprinopsis marcescibilis TaxID=230819 RepID=A0A5C3L650_COPMA|nr:hypothetical protein FA15DRAFT_652890 [Coprinopsis marcescibilis]
MAWWDVGVDGAEVLFAVLAAALSECAGAILDGSLIVRGQVVCDRVYGTRHGSSDNKDKVHCVGSCGGSMSSGPRGQCGPTECRYYYNCAIILDNTKLCQSVCCYYDAGCCTPTVLRLALIDDSSLCATSEELNDRPALGIPGTLVSSLSFLLSQDDRDGPLGVWASRGPTFDKVKFYRLLPHERAFTMPWDKLKLTVGQDHAAHPFSKSTRPSTPCQDPQHPRGMVGLTSERFS